MVAYYNLFGAKVGSHWLAIGTLSTMFLGVYAATGSSKKSLATSTPPINASSKDEENFIQEFLKQAEPADKKAEKH